MKRYKKMSRQVKVMLAGVAMLLMFMPVLAACPPPRPEVPTIRIGVIGPMKFLPGEQHWFGATIAAEEINAAGGVNVGGVRHNIELIKADDNSILSVLDAVTAMERLVTVDRVHFVVGGFRSEAVLAQQEVMADHRVIFVGVGPGHPEHSMRVARDYDRYKYWFRGHINSKQLVHAMMGLIEMTGRTVQEKLGVAVPRVAILADRAIWADPVVDGVGRLLPMLGMAGVGVWRPSAVAADLTAELTAIEIADAHILVTALGGPSGIVFGSQWGALKIPAAAVGFNMEAMAGGYWEATGGAAEYELTINFLGPAAITPKTIPFWNHFIERFGTTPMYCAGTYDAIYMLKAAIERAGTLDSDAVVVEMEKTDYHGVMGRLVFMGMDTPTPRCVRFGPGYATGTGTQWRDGGLVVVWPDGRAVLGEPRWVGVRYEGTVDYKLPPWMVEYWRGRL
jgi:branched-chain amino acid transport system substrate-binding protein